ARSTAERAAASGAQGRTRAGDDRNRCEDRGERPDSDAPQPARDTGRRQSVAPHVEGSSGSSLMSPSNRGSALARTGPSDRSAPKNSGKLGTLPTAVSSDATAAANEGPSTAASIPMSETTSTLFSNIDAYTKIPVRPDVRPIPRVTKAARAPICTLESISFFD